MELFRSIKLYGAEKITLIYMFLTAGVVVFLLLNNFPVWNLLLIRLGITVLILGLAYLTTLNRNRFTIFLRFVLIGSLLAYWYPETFELNRYSINKDFLIAQWEQNLFHCQPALIFNQLYPQKIVSELMNLGYFSYFPMIIASSIYFFFKERPFFHRYFFVILFAFLVYYFIFVLFPVSGPQYYFEVIGKENAFHGIFPPIGNFFSQHYIELPQVQSGFFNKIVELTQSIGERPTAAFPSSHVGISTLMMIMLLRYKTHALFFFLFPFYILLVFSTVYIQAHYAVDVIAGFCSAFVLYYIGINFFEIKMS